VAENGMDALAKIASREPDLVISDVMMPEMDGFELCKKIKTTAETAHIPVILLTALEDDKNKLKGLEYGADGYISKPFSTRYLEMKIKKLIENNRKIKEYFSRNSKIPDKSIDMCKRDKLFLKHAIEAIDKNISDSDFGVEELANEIGLSPSQFYRRLKQLTGQVPNVFIRNYRLQKAAELLRSNEGFTVSEVMYQIGIESSSYFSTSFKKLHGITPSEFIKV
jgi:YesN/AraC family two-component response regulator